jgi:hypothetical protein
MPKATLSRQLEAVAHPLTGALTDSEPLFALIGNGPLCPAWRGLVRYARVLSGTRPDHQTPHP